jgi:FMN phosphatase YigB (HAD superfamily)
MKYKIKLKERKYLFLDIDGVLNSFDDYNMTGDEFLRKLSHISFKISKRQMNILNEIIKQYNPKIILSSYWRTRYSLKELNNIFKENGLEGKISDVTDSKGEEHKDRWSQIKRYIDDKNIKNYIILDDENLTRKKQDIPNFVRTNSYEGLTEKHLREIGKIW